MSLTNFPSRPFVQLIPALSEDVFRYRPFDFAQGTN
jgi:hypothetical protein